MNPQISNISEEAGLLRFTLSGVNVSLANALRRVILNDIDTVVFRTETYNDNKCTIAVNTSRQHNEMVKQRLSCVPIHSTDLNELPDKYVLEIDVTNNTEHIIYVTTEDFKVKNKASGEYLSKADCNRLFPMNMLTQHYIDLVRLRPKIGDIPGEQLKLTCEFSVANAGINSMFNVVSKCAYGNTPDAEKAKEAWTKVENKMRADGSTETEVEYAHKNFYMLDAQRHFVEDSFDFVVGTVGVFTNNDIVKKACAKMQTKILDFLNLVETRACPIEVSATTMENCYDISLENEDYTLGKALEFYFYDQFYMKSKKLNFCAFKKMHPHDSSSRIRVAYVQNVSVNDIETDLIQACKELQEVYVAIYKMF